MLLLPIKGYFLERFVSAGGGAYDFIEHAPEASWTSSAGPLPFPGRDDDPRGFALYRYNWVLEDGGRRERILETHPQWLDKRGYIMGTYPETIVPENAKLNVEIGFLQGALNTDGVIFEVRFMDEEGSVTTLMSQQILYDNKLDSFTQDLHSLAGKMGRFILYVGVKGTSAQDWAAWVEAKIEVSTFPDLVVTDIWREGNIIHYMMKNIGDEVVGSPGKPATIYNDLIIDGVRVARDKFLGTIGVNQEVERVFEYYWQAKLQDHDIRVCMDSENSVKEGNEKNNCRGERWVSLADLTVSSVSFSPKNPKVGEKVDLTFVISNLGNFTSGACRGALLIEKTVVLLTGVTDLPPGESRKIELTWTPVSAGTLELVFYIDYENNVREFKEDNNYLKFKVEVVPGIPIKPEKPDLEALGISWEPERISAGDNVKLKPLIRNTGSSLSPPCTVEFKVNGIHIGSTTIPRIPAGGQLKDVADISLSWVPLEAGTYQVSFFADANNEVDEVDEENNEVVVSIEVGPKIIAPPPTATMAFIAGYIENFPYNSDTLKIELCAARQACGFRIDPITGERTWYCTSVCIEGTVPHRYEVMPTQIFRKYYYSIGGLDPFGSYIVRPVYQRCEGQDCVLECEWRGMWNPEYAFVIIEGGSKSANFTFQPLGLEPPTVDISFSNEHPSANEDVEISVSARDDKGVEKMFIKIDVSYWDGSVTEGVWREISFTSSYDSSSRMYHALGREEFSQDNVRSIVVNAVGCDIEGNRRISSPRVLHFGCPDINFRFSMNGRMMESDLPIFGFPDRDGDGLNDCWEDAAMRQVNPYIELDEYEDLLATLGDHVVNFARITPYPSRENPTHILFYYVVSWSSDYGRTVVVTFEEHPGDTEPLIMAWSVVDDHTIVLEYVYIGAHGGCCKRYDLWSAYGTSCNDAGVCSFSQEKVFEQTLCSNLRFRNNRLYLYASEDKHALYPTCEICENVLLVEPDFLGTGDCGESWESFGICLADIIVGIWNFLVEIVKALLSSILSFILHLFTFWEDDHLEDQIVMLDYATLQRMTEEQQEIHFQRGNYHYILYWHVEKYMFPYVAIVLDSVYSEVADDDWGSSEPFYVIVGVSLTPEGIRTWVPEPVPPVGDDVDSGEWDEDFPRIVVYSDVFSPHSLIGFSVSLFEADDPRGRDILSIAINIAQELKDRLSSEEEGGGCGPGVFQLLIEKIFFPELEVGEDCAGGEVRLFPVYNVGELDSMDHLFFNDLGGEPLAPEDRFPGNSLIGIEQICDSNINYKFCGGQTTSCSCGTSILSWMKIPGRDTIPFNTKGSGMPEKLERVLKP
ncbi:MAG: CARDB domain-containing protein [Nitrososphaerota archaeon]